LKVTISYQIDYEDLPKTMGQLLKNLYEIEYPEVGQYFLHARTHMLTGAHSDALGSIDTLRQELAKLDQKLVEYSNIIQGFAKADVDLKFGIPPEGLAEMLPNNTQEVSAENILDEKNEND
jgi:Mg2+ and Co2+ transporter CorA